MRKITIALGTLFIQTLFLTSTASAFTDLQEGQNPYQEAITNLASQGVIQGYPDGTFRPENTVNRAEFLKMAITGSGKTIETKTLIQGKKIFKDVSDQNWFSPYVKKAVMEGWIEGYNDQTFRPGNEVTKAEALKILGKIQNWQLLSVTEKPFIDASIDSWFTPYAQYAKNQGYIRKSRTLFPGKKLNRGEIADLIYKTKLSGTITLETANKKTPTVQPQINAGGRQEIEYELLNDPSVLENTGEPPQEATGSNTPAKKVSRTIFDNITLNKDFTTIFYGSEVYNFEGVINKKVDTMLAFLNYQDGSGKSNFINFSVSTKPSGEGSAFRIPVFFEKKGKYSLGILPATEKNTKVVEIIVREMPKPLTEQAVTPLAPENLELKYDDKNDQTTLQWTKNEGQVHKITFSQGGKERTMILRNNEEAASTAIPRKILSMFQKGEISIKLQSSYATSIGPLTENGPWNMGISHNFQATRHIRKKIETKSIVLNGYTGKMAIGQEIRLTGTALIPIQKTAVIRKDDGFTEDVKLDASEEVAYHKIQIIPQGKTYTLSWSGGKSGAYQVEINNQGGSAVANLPVYIGETVPLLPDYFEINEYKDFLEESMEKASLRSQMLNKVNIIRQIQGLNQVTLRDDLNTLAQNHADDMAKRGFFAHINPDGKTPQDRRQAMGIPTQVGENLALSPSLIYGINGLMDSPVHRKNILEGKWTNVGFGFAKDQEGNLITVQEFSTKPLDAQDIQNLESDILREMNQERIKNGRNALTQDEILQSAAQLWSDKIAKLDTLSFDAPDGTSIDQILKEKNVRASAGIFLYDANTTEGLQDYIISQASTLQENWKRVGIGISVTQKGDMKITLILAE